MADIKIGNLTIDKAYIGNNEIIKIYYGNTLIYEKSVKPSVDPILANNSWDTIKAVCESGDVDLYWAIGDEKTDLGSDNVTRTMVLLDNNNLYGKHVVFGFKETTSSTYQWNLSSNVDNNNAENNYSISTMQTTHLATIKGLLSSELQATLTQTTVKVAKNGNSTTLLNVTNYLFLPACKELSTSPRDGRFEENSALTTFKYYKTHTSASARIKYGVGTSTAKSYWTRSPRSGWTDVVCSVNSNGSWNGNYGASYSDQVAPCFSY